MKDGLTTHGVAIDVKQNTADKLQADLATAREALAAYNTARAAKAPLVATVAQAEKSARAFLTTARDALKPALGSRWSPAWADAGFVDRSLAIPVAPGDIMEQVSRMGVYLAANTTREVAALQVTAGRAAAVHTALSNARSALNAQESALAGAKVDRDGAIANLRKRMRGTIAELNQLLPPDSSDWPAFGLKMPGATESPEVPAALDATPGAAGTGTVHLTWADAPRANRYRVWRQLPGEPAPVGIASVRDTDTSLNGQTIGQLIKYYISAVNAAGESQRTEPREVTLG